MKNSEKQLLGYKMARTQWYQRTLLNSLFKKHNVPITNEQWVVMKIIGASPAISQTEIATRSLKDKTNITRILDLLQTNDYIARARDPQDRRRFQISLSAKGKKVLQSVAPVIEEGERILTANLSKQELAAVKNLLDRISESIKGEI